MSFNAEFLAAMSLVDMARTLDENEFLMTLTDEKFRLLIHDAAERGYSHLVDHILLRHPEMVDALDYEGNTPLMMAAANGKSATITILMSYGAGINKRNRVGCSAFAFAICAQHYDDAIYLIQHGANVDTCDIGGNTPMHIAAFNSNLRAIDLLMLAGANPNVQNLLGNTPLHVASCMHSIPTMQRLLGAGTSVILQNVNGRTAMDEYMINML